MQLLFALLLEDCLGVVPGMISSNGQALRTLPRGWQWSGSATTQHLGLSRQVVNEAFAINHEARLHIQEFCRIQMWAEAEIDVDVGEGSAD